MATLFAERHELFFQRQYESELLRMYDDQQYALVDDMAFLVSKKDDFRVFAFTGDKWPNGEVFYEFAPSVTGSPKADMWKSQFVKACQEWSGVAKVKFTPRTTQTAYIYVENSTKNEAAIGCTKQKQLFTILNWERHFIIAHELGHTLGLDHEQCRSDRDTYVRIHEDNIKEGKKNNFAIENGSVNYSGYDFESIMHYDDTAFAIDTSKPTISAKEPYKAKQKLMGNRTHFSANDKADMASHYGKPES